MLFFSRNKQLLVTTISLSLITNNCHVLNIAHNYLIILSQYNNYSNFRLINVEKKINFLPTPLIKIKVSTSFSIDCFVEQRWCRDEPQRRWLQCDREVNADKERWRRQERQTFSLLSINHFLSLQRRSYTL
jgi:hypothetical protein